MVRLEENKQAGKESRPVTQGESEKTTPWPARGIKRCCIRLFFGLVAPLSLLTVGCGLPGRPDPAERPVPADRVLKFSVLYRQNCAGCHGVDGKLGPAPPLNNPLFRAIVPMEELKGILAKGRNKTLMPAFANENGGVLTATQIQVLENEIKGIPYRIVEKQEAGVNELEVVADASGISPAWGTPEQPPKGVPSYAHSASPSGNKERGASVFARACAVCHGNQGQGIEQESRMVRAINDPVFLALISNQALRRYAITGRPDRGMPGYAQARPGNPHFVPLTDREVTDLVALLASWRKEK
jgi:cytochrome c oxidase cbb3-type subunit 3/ubiquinol-cytochrome c reductase cytochrome c subunit